MLMKLADYVAYFIREEGIHKVFAIQGGACAHLIDSIAKMDGIEYICNQHEQASAMSADGYARITGDVGCVIATSGPGATNLLTGVCGAYYDSIPMLVITGQVSTTRQKGNLDIRLWHTQETDVVSIFRSIVKYAVQIRKPDEIRYELEKAVSIAREGRPGPVLIDIPDDLQREYIEVDELKSFSPKTISEDRECISSEKKNQITYAIRSLLNASRPLIVGGYGIHASKAEGIFIEFVNEIKIPSVFTWGGNDLLANDSQYKKGTIGINGSSEGNTALRKADVILFLGTRLNSNETIEPLNEFVTSAKKIIVDIDKGELDKYAIKGCNADCLIEMDISDFLHCGIAMLAEERKRDDKADFGDGRKINTIGKVCDSKDVYPLVDPYLFFDYLSDLLNGGEKIFIDTGSSMVWFEQGFHFKEKQRACSSFNNTPMGWSLPASIGGALASQGKTICITGDGGLQMNIQELSTVVHYNLNVLILVFNNNGYGMIHRTQDRYLDGRHEASDINSGVGFPNIVNVFEAYGFKTFQISDNSEIEKIRAILKEEGPVVCNVLVSLDRPY